MNESLPKTENLKRVKERKKTYTQQSFFDCDKESKIKGCQQSGPRNDWFYMKFMKNQRYRSPSHPPSPML